MNAFYEHHQNSIQFGNAGTISSCINGVGCTKW
jgi:hypothetical protein